MVCVSPQIYDLLVPDESDDTGRVLTTEAEIVFEERADGLEAGAHVAADGVAGRGHIARSS